MARITNNLLVQRADDLIVLIDEFTGEEVAFPVTLAPNVVGAIQYLIAPGEVPVSVNGSNYILNYGDEQ